MSDDAETHRPFDGKPYRLAEFENRLNHVNCFPEQCVSNKGLRTKICWTFVTTCQCVSSAVEEVGLCKMSCVSTGRTVQDARWQLNSLTFASNKLMNFHGASH